MTISVDEFLAKHSTAPFRATIEAAAGDKVKITPWTSAAGCQCSAALELPKSVIQSIEVTSNEHNCCGQTLRVAQVTFVPEQSSVLTAVFRQLQQRKTMSDDCMKACSICRRYPWKTGPCSVCEDCNAGGDEE